MQVSCWRVAAIKQQSLHRLHLMKSHTFEIFSANLLESNYFLPFRCLCIADKHRCFRQTSADTLPSTVWHPGEGENMTLYDQTCSSTSYYRLLLNISNCVSHVFWFSRKDNQHLKQVVASVGINSCRTTRLQRAKSLIRCISKYPPNIFLIL